MVKWNGRTGLNPPDRRPCEIRFEDVIVSDLAREALQKEGHKVTGRSVILNPECSVPPEIRVYRSFDERLFIQAEGEPISDGEYPASWWERGYFTPCPECGAPLIILRGDRYVPVYGICGKSPYHHVEPRPE